MTASALPRAVTTITPQRVSFAGGGTDLPDFYLHQGGAVLSSTIDKYIYVTVKKHSPLFEEAYRLSYSQTEHTQSLEEIKNEIARECLRLVPVEPPLFISTAADLPASSGLGSSSSFAVGLLYALHAMRGEDVSAGQLAEEACHVEIHMLRHPIGKQDQYAAAFGGLNHIVFRADGRVQLDHVQLPGAGIKALFKHLMLVWTGMQRSAGDILSEQKGRVSETAETLHSMRAMAEECREVLLRQADNFEALGALLHRGWEAKRSLASKITNPQIDDLYFRARAAGCWGGKIAGAGGGGFLLLVVPPSKQKQVRASLQDSVHVPIDYEPRGARILSVVRG